METSPSPENECAVDEDFYVYTPLPPGPSFRCLALEPGSGEDPLRCSIRISAIADEDYEAISYVWGSEVREHRIFCNGRTIRITENLFLALRRIRDRTEIRHLWADSVCIDQENDIEKGHQVSIMSQIYSRARRVLIYMGPDPEGHGPQVASLLSETGEMIQREIDKLVSLEWNSFPDLYQDIGNPLLHDKRWLSYKALSKQQWFVRGWVVREVGLAKEGMIIWGDGEFTWTNLMRTTIWIAGKNVAISLIPPTMLTGRMSSELAIHVDVYLDRNHHTLRIFLLNLSWSPSRMVDYLARGRYLKFKDRRDSVYAFTDLALESADLLRLAPDYTQSPSEAFKAFTIQYLRITGDTTILSFVNHSTRPGQSELPSWVPRWEAIEPKDDDRIWEDSFLTLQEATGFTKPEVLDEETLKLRGILLGEVRYVSDVLRISTTTAELISKLWQDMQRPAPGLRDPNDISVIDFVVTLLFGFDLSSQKEEHERCLDTYTEELTNGTLGNNDWGDTDERLQRFNVVNSAIKTCSNAKRLMVTGSGHIGLAPAVACQGDLCVRLSGSKSLSHDHHYLLRATERYQYYRVVGIAWTLYDMEPKDADDGAGAEDEGEKYNDDFYLI
ncbi:heterokaryon incompatibility protein-domain-containing protein [Boeremia exigua]|uniref:heterokaryon incompatibility protein-domain-containing protein n=1 Tax=Boeremia exigua TaxID=749465 RepID=UPI001E8CFAFB|nr:heterokaryon incompatibility protein-domain-containing protein [Boeremia exigua]KAH6639073.1 heterokaryon incompatibility protein-domain-containing protein [Boeremia exigua]